MVYMRVKKRKRTLDHPDQWEIANAFVIRVLELSREAYRHYVSALKDDYCADEDVVPLLREIKSLKHTLNTFCDEIGVSPLDLLATHHCGLREWENADKVYCDGSPTINAKWLRALMEYVR